MRTQQERPHDTGATRPDSQTTPTQQSAGSTDVARPVPAATEPSALRSPRSGWPSTLRTGFPANPWALMRSMSEDIDRLIDNLTGLRTGTSFDLTTPRAGGTGSGFDFGAMTPATWAPQVEVVQKPNALVLRADLPGLKPDEVSVSVDDGMLTISGERKQEHKEERDGFLRTERSYGQFYRAFPLPAGADEDKIAASFRNGVLEILVPVSGREGGRRIKVEA